MKITHTMVIMFIGSFIIQYYLMSPIMVSNRIYITNNIGKAYIATIMGLFMYYGIMITVYHEQTIIYL